MLRARLGRILLLVGSQIALLAGVWAGLIRLGWGLHPLHATLPEIHGPLMVGGFLGTLIGLERAVALRRFAAYIPPALAALGGLTLLAGLPVRWAGALFLLASLGLTAVFIVLVRLHSGLSTITMGLGALAWMAGNLFWLAGLPIERLALWWAGFLVLTVAGERLELSRYLGTSHGKTAAFVLAVSLFLAGLLAGVAWPGPGTRCAGVGLVALALWLLRHDMARMGLGREGLNRYVAVCLLSGYVWLGVGGILAIFQGAPSRGPAYDALLHSLFLGFVFALIFAHAPIVFPAVLRVSIDFRPAFYAHLILLHLSLVVRLGADLGGWTQGRMWGGMLNAVALLLFLANTVRSMRRTRTPLASGV